METTRDLPDDLTPTKKAARAVGAHVSTLHRWIQRGFIRGWRRRACGQGVTVVSMAEVRAMCQPVRIKPREGGAVETPGEREGRLARVDAELRRLGVG